MRKISWKILMTMSMALFFAMFTFTACEEDDDDNNPDDGGDQILVEDGIYLRGEGTALTELDVNGLFQSTRNEVNQTERAELMEVFVAVEAGDAGFNIVEVVGGEPTVYGPGGDFAAVAEADLINDEPKAGIWRGTYEASETAFTVPEDALYHVVIDTELKKVAIGKVAYWGIIGAATPNGWSGDTEMASTGFDKESMTFEATDVTLSKGDYKFRYGGGWKIVIDDTYEIDAETSGLRVNTNFGGAVDALVPGGDNINNDVLGKFTVSMAWELGAGFTATLEKTGDADITDYTNTELGLVGDGIIVDGAANDWETTLFVSTPDVDETTYTWTWDNVEVTTAGSFKIREGQTWDNFSAGYPQVNMEGAAAEDFETNNDGNFVPKADGTYNFVLTIDALTETYTFNVTAADGPQMEVFMTGGALGGWDWTDNFVEMSWVSGNTFEATTEFIKDEAFRFFAQQDWNPDSYNFPYFIDNGGSVDELLVDAEDGDNNFQFTGETGDYKITVDFDAFTVEMEAVTK